MNIWSLSTAATRKKLTRILDLTCTINILTDTCTSIEDVDKTFLNRKLVWKLGNFKHLGTYTKMKGIINIYNNSIVKVKQLKIVQAGQLVSFLVKANNDWVNFTTIYAPADKDNTNFMLKAKQSLDTMEGDLGINVVILIPL